VQIVIIISQVTSRQMKSYTNAHHTVVKNGVIINYIFLY